MLPTTNANEIDKFFLFPPTTTSSVPIYDFAIPHTELAEKTKKAKFDLEAAAMAGHEGARNDIGHLEFLQFNNTDRAIKHWIIAASAGSYLAMNAMRSCFENGIDIDRESLNSTLAAYNTSCGEMRSEARDAYICSFLGIDLGDFN